MTYTVKIEPVGYSIQVEEGQTILDASLRAGIYLPHACGHGLCATCKISVLDGEVEHGAASNFALMDFERDEGKCLACCAIPQSDLVIEADVEQEPDAQNLPVHDFSGVVTRIWNLTTTIKGIGIRLDQEAGIRFQAGQYVNLLAAGEQEARAFSLANPPSQARFLELNVRLVPGGKVTTWIHESLKEGDAVKLSGPYGRFFVRKSAALPMLFLAGGSGLSSPRSMILDLLEKGETLPITLFYGARTQCELYYHDDLEHMTMIYPNFVYRAVLSDEPKASDWQGLRGYVHDAAKDYFKGDFRGWKAYLCGPPPMIDACITALIQGRLFERDIYTEKFYSEADAQQVRSPLFRKI